MMKSTERRVPRITGLPTNAAGSRTMRKGSVMDFSLSAILSQFYPVAYLGDTPKIRDEILEDAISLGGMGFSPILGSAAVAGLSGNRLRELFFAVRAGDFEG